MRDSRPQSLEKWFNNTQNSDVLQHIQLHALVLNKLNNIVRKLLPPPLLPWVRVTNFRRNILVIEVASASLLMRLRYEQAALLSALRVQILPSLASIDITINPSLAAKTGYSAQEGSTQSTEGQSASDRRLSIKSAALLRNVAEHSPEKLKRTLERLASLASERCQKNQS